MNTQDRERLLNKARENIKVIREVLDIPISPDDLVGCQDKLIRLIEVAGLSSYTEAIAKSVYESELAEAFEIEAMANEKLGHTSILIIAKGKVSQYQSAVIYAERLGRNISHSMEALRTIISLAKSEMEQSKWGNQV